MAAPRWFVVCLCALMLVPYCLPAKENKMAHILTVDDHKEFKKILRTRTNVLSLFAKSEKHANPIIETFAQVAKDMKGLGTLVFVDCSDKDGKKLCKKVKAYPDPYELKHYKDGDFNKPYDRQETYKSMMNFLRDPTGDIPWEEDPTAKDVVHLNSDKELNKLVKKEKTPILMMFYAPWCGHCKRLKPDFAAAASELKGQAKLAGMDVDKPENEAVRRLFNITGFPTLLYFEGGRQKFKYGGENNRQGIVDWMKDPQPPVEKAPEPEWSDVESDVVHLTDDTFDTYLEEHPSVLVMFYAPWCGHCKKMKPEYDEAATTLKEEEVEGVLAAVDATKATQVAKRFDVKGYPTVKYFKDGEEAFGFNDRTADKIVDFMKDPKEPPPPPPPEQPWQDVESEVVHLSDEDFKSQLKRRKHTLVMFYAPWCGHCKKAKPEFQSAAEKYKEDSKVTFAAVDCTTQQGVCGQYEVRGYPTIKYFNYGKNPKDYEGGREEADFVAFMSDPLNPTPPTPPPKDPAEEWAELEGAEEVVHLHDNNFEDFIQQHSSVLVMFYAPWCGHCKAMKPDYALAAKELKTDEVPGVLAAVDATVERMLQSKYDIKGFPTLKHFKDGEFNTDYNKGRNVATLVEFMKNPQKALPPPPPEPEWSEVPSDINHLTDDTFDGFVKEHESVLVMFYAPWCGHCKKMKPAYQEAAEQLKTEMPGAKLAAVDATKYSDLGSKYEVRGYPTIKYFKNGELAFQYNKGRTTDEIVAFMKDPKEPPPPPPPEPEWPDVPSKVNHLTDETFDPFLQEHSSVLVMFYAPWCGHCKKMKPDYQEAADILSTEKPEAKLAAVDATKYPELTKKYEITGYPTLKYFKDGKEPFSYLRGRTTKDIISFMKNPQPPTPPPEAEKEWSEEASDVVHLTDATFPTYMEENSPVLVMFYAPWCGHCKRAKPEYVKAAELLKKDGVSAKLAAVDCTKHFELAKKYEVKGYPTFKLFKNGEFDSDYNLGRTSDDFVNFLVSSVDTKPKEEAKPKEEKKEEEPSQEQKQPAKPAEEAKPKEEKKEVKEPEKKVEEAKAKEEQKEVKEPEKKVEEAKPKEEKKEVKEPEKKVEEAKPEEKKKEEPQQKAPEAQQPQKEAEKPAEDKKERPKRETPPSDEWASTDAAADVNFLTSETFDQFLADHASVLVMFYAPWCGHCKRMKPAYEEAATKLKTELPTAKLAALDATQYKDVGKKYEVRGYPTLVYFKNGKEELKYKLGRSTQELVNFMKNPQQAAPPPKTEEKEWAQVPSEINHLTDQTFESFVYRHSSVLVMFYAPWCGHCKRMKPAYQEAAEQLKTEKPEAKLAAVDATKYRELGQKYGVRGYPTLKYFKNGQLASDYNQGRSKEDLVAFMKTPQVTPPKKEEPQVPPAKKEEPQVPPAKKEEPKPAATPQEGDWESSAVNHLTADSFNSFIQQHHSVLVMFYAPWCGHCKRMKPAYVEAAERLKTEKPEARLAAVDATQYQALGTQYGVRGYPTIKFFQDGKEAFTYQKGRTTNDLVAFMKDPQAPPPTPPPEQEWSEVPSDINHLTDDTFDGFLKEHESVLVMFYAPWCGHCKRMKPAYQEAAEQLKTANPEAKLAAVDATKYSALGKTYGVRGYPTIKYFRSGKEIQKYTGARDTGSLVEFMRNPPKVTPPEFTEGPSAVVTPLKSITAFDKFVQSYEHTLVLYYKKDSPKYPQTKAPFMKTASAFRDDNRKMFGAVDCDAVADLCVRAGIVPEALPTIKFYIRGKFSTNYKDPLTNIDLYNFMNTGGEPVKTQSKEEL